MTNFQMLFVLLLQGTTKCFQVQLTGPMYVRRNEAMHVSCRSNQVPFGLTADFLVNGKTYTSLRSTDSGCYSARLTTRCPSHSVVCYCDKDGKKYGLFIQASAITSTMNVLCLMKFRNGRHISQSNDLIVKVYDPPILSIKETMQCNSSTSVEMTCDSLGVAVIYDDWYHSFNGSFVKKMKGEHIGNRSTISIGSCGIKDSGTYMCKAGYTIENETFWINVSTNLEFHGPPIPFETHGTTKPTKFSIVFYSSAHAIIVKWYKDGVTLENSTDFELMTNRYNISVDTDGNPMVLRGYMTSLTIVKQLSGVYTVLLRNHFGEYEHQFSIPTGKRGFSLQTFMWILICIAVFLINSTIATLTRRRRSRRSLKGSGNIGTVGIYYAAPSTAESASQYNSTTPQNDTDATDNATSSLYAEINDEQVQREESDEISHHYIELE